MYNIIKELKNKNKLKTKQKNDAKMMQNTIIKAPLNTKIVLILLTFYRIYSIKRHPRINAASERKNNNRRRPRINSSSKGIMCEHSPGKPRAFEKIGEMPGQARIFCWQILCTPFLLWLSDALVTKWDTTTVQRQSKWFYYFYKSFMVHKCASYSNMTVF